MAVARSENPGGHIVLIGDNVSPLVEIGLTDLSKVKLSKKRTRIFHNDFYGNENSSTLTFSSLGGGNLWLRSDYRVCT